PFDLRQQLGMLRGIVGRTQVAGGSPIKDLPNAITNPRRSHRQIMPDWFKTSQHLVLADRAHRYVTDSRVDVLGQRIVPLPAVRLAPIVLLVRLEKARGAFLERNRARSFEPDLRALDAAALQWIGVLKMELPAHLVRQVARLCEGAQFGRAQAHHVRLAAMLI